MWSDHLVLGLLHRSTGQTARFIDFVADQLIGLFTGRFYFTVNQLTGLFVARALSSAILGAYQLSWGLLGVRIVCRFIVSYAGGSLAMLGTPRCLDSSCKRLQLSWGLPWWLDHLSDGLHRQPTGQTTQRSLLLGAHSCSALTPARRLVGWTAHRMGFITSYAGDSSVLGHHQLHRGLHGVRTSPATRGTPWCSDIASYGRDSSMFGFFVQASSAKLRTPLVVGSCYVSSVCYQATP